MLGAVLFKTRSSTLQNTCSSDTYLPPEYGNNTNKTSWVVLQELISDVLLCTLTHGTADVGRPANIYIHQICADTGFRLENLVKLIADPIYQPLHSGRI